MAGTDVLGHTLRLGKRPLFKRDKQKLRVSAAELSTDFTQEAQPWAPREPPALGYVVATIAIL